VQGKIKAVKSGDLVRIQISRLSSIKPEENNFSRQGRTLTVWYSGKIMKGSNDN